MKWSLVLIVLVLGACRGFILDPSSLDPTTAREGSAVIPRVGSEYVYQDSGLDAEGQALEHVETVWISSCLGGFVACRTSDTVDGISTRAIDSFLVRDDGDLIAVRGGRVIFPIWTQSTYIMTTKDPQELTMNTFTYLGTESVKVGDTSYLCSKIDRQERITPSGGRAYEVSMTYWYCSKIGYFLKEQSQSSDVKIKNYTRVLTSFKLGS